jgi:hypothetical protein
MKRILGLVMSFFLLAAAAGPAFGQTPRGRYNQQRRYETSRRVYDNRYEDRYDDRYGDDRSVWEKHRDKITVAGGTAAGAVVGGVAGGKKGAIIGAILGAAGSALYTYKIRDDDDDRRFRR